MPQPKRRRVRAVHHHAAPETATPAASNAWTDIHPHDQVVVQEPSRIPYRAVVDTLTRDSGVVWVLPLTAGSRRAFHCFDNVRIYSLSDWATQATADSQH